MTDIIRSDFLHVDFLHGGLPESRHRVIAALANHDGQILQTWGDIDALVCIRSALKPLQAIALVTSGAFDAFDLSDRELCLACSSHNGEPVHVEAVRAWLKTIGATESDLACGATPPATIPAVQALARSGEDATTAHNGCSGKHTGFLTLARHLGAELEGYCKLDHPVQKAIFQTFHAFGLDPAETSHCNTDFCNAPNLFASFSDFTSAFGRMTNPADTETARAISRIFKAIGRYPELLGGTGRLCTKLTEAASPDIIGKSGAEGAYVSIMPRQGQALLVKALDGAPRAAEFATVHILTQLGHLDPERKKALAGYIDAPVLSGTETPIGHFRVQSAS